MRREGWGEREERKKARQTEKEVGRQYQGMDRPGVRKVLKGSGKQCKMEETGCESHPWCPNDPRRQGVGEDVGGDRLQSERPE